MENVAEARTDGIEAFLQWLPTASLSVSGSYTWLRTAENRTTGGASCAVRSTPAAFPPPTGSALGPARYERAPRLLFGGHELLVLPGRERGERRLREVDAGVTVTPWPHLSLVARVENLLDDDYEEAYGFPALGRTFWGGAAVQF